MEKAGLISAIWIPVLSKNRVLGVMVVVRGFISSLNAKSIFWCAGSQLSMALENAPSRRSHCGKAYIESLSKMRRPDCHYGLG
jgi:hypothetical protein